MSVKYLVSDSQITYKVHNQSYDVMYDLLLSAAVTSHRFAFIPYVDIPYISASFKISGRCEVLFVSL